MKDVEIAMIKEIVVLQKPYKVRKTEKGTILYNWKSLSSTYLSDLSAFIIENCNGKNTLEDVVKLIKEEERLKFFKESESYQVISIFLSKNVLGSNLKNFENRVSVQQDNNLLRLVTLQLTKHCNLKCIHCYIDADCKQKGIMEEKVFNKIVQELREMDPVEVVITGGEPLLHPNIYEYCRKLYENEIPFSIFTNGMLIDEEFVDKIKELYPISVQVSIDGVTKDINDKIRGEGTYRQSLKGISLLRKAGIRVTISSVLNRVNYEQYRLFPEFVKSLGASNFNVTEIMCSGRGENRELHLSKEEVLEAQSYYTRYRINNKEPQFGEIRLIPSDSKVHKTSLCSAGRNSIFIDYEGNIHPCQTFPSGFNCGNITQTPLEQIWNASQILKQVRSYTLDSIEQCSSCEIKGYCSGGCLGYNLTINGSVLSNFEQSSCYCKRELFKRYYLEEGVK
jgi:radical SAM protein with 4Fe4S-binding SPASM domain